MDSVSKCDEFQKKLHEEFFNSLLGIPTDLNPMVDVDLAMEFARNSMLTLSEVSSQIYKLNMFHDMFYPIFVDSCRRKVVSGPTRLKLISDYCEVNLAVRECLKKILKGVTFVHRWKKLIDCLVAAIDPEPEVVLDERDFYYSPPVSPGVFDDDLPSFANFRKWTLCLSMLKEEMFCQQGLYEKTLLDFEGTFDFEKYQSPVDDTCYLEWSDRTSKRLGEKLRLMLNKLRQDQLNGSVKLLVYSMTYVLWWCTMISSLAFVPRLNGQINRNPIYNGLIWRGLPKVPWAVASDRLFRNLQILVPEDINYGSLWEIKRMADSIKRISDLFDGVEYSSITSDIVDEVKPHVVELGRDTFLFVVCLEGFEVRLKETIEKLADSFGKALDLMEEY